MRMTAHTRREKNLFFSHCLPPPASCAKVFCVYLQLNFMSKVFVFIYTHAHIQTHIQMDSIDVHECDKCIFIRRFVEAHNVIELNFLPFPLLFIHATIIQSYRHVFFIIFAEPKIFFFARNRRTHRCGISNSMTTSTTPTTRTRIHRKFAQKENNVK